MTRAASVPPVITSGNVATFTVGSPGSSTVTATGTPTPSLGETGALPSGVAFVDNHDGSATLAGTPAAGTANSYLIKITASNTTGSGTQSFSQDFTLTVNPFGTAPAITSTSKKTFAVGSAGTFTVTAAGNPTAALSRTGALPSGVTFVDHGNGTATLAGTPAGGSAQSYPITIKATNTAGSALQAFDLVVNPLSVTPAIRSGNSATFTVSAAGSSTLTATGVPTPGLSETGSLPGGVTFVDKHDGTATLAGTPGAGAAGGYPITIKATNTAGSATQAFTLTVQPVSGAPTITSASVAAFAVGAAGTFSVAATGNPKPILSETGSLPSGVTFIDHGNGTATLAGTPAAGTAGSYPIAVKATNTAGAATQQLDLVVNEAPLITSGIAATFTVGSTGSSTVTATGAPTSSLGETGALPSGVAFLDNHDGSATLAGTPAAGTAGSYPITISASNGVPPNAAKTFTLTVNPFGTAPAITSTSKKTFMVGLVGTFTVTTTGNPAAALSRTGALPSGVTFVDHGNGTATLAGTPAAGTTGSYPITIRAANTAGSAVQQFDLVVSPAAPGAPAITSAKSATFVAGSAGTFMVTATGSPKPALSKSGALPSGVTFVDNHNGTATLAGTPAAATVGVWPITITATNTVGTATQAFTLIVFGLKPAHSGSGYWLVASDGGIFTFGDAPFYGSLGNLKLAQPIVGMAATVNNQGYWLVASNGDVFSFGDAHFYGSMGGVRLNQSIVGMAVTPTGNGYWLVARDGGVFSFGDAKFYGSTGNMKLNQPVVGMAATTHGYWLVASDGGVFSFGDARFYGSTGNMKLNQPVVGMTAAPFSAGYWLGASDGGVFTFGSAKFYGSTGNVRLVQPVVGIQATSSGAGYWMVAKDGGIFSFGDAGFVGSTGGMTLNQPIVGMDAHQ